MDKMRRLLNQPASRRNLLLEAACWLTIARLALLILPFRIIALWLGPVLPPGEAGRSDGMPETAAIAEDVGWAVRRAALHLPFEAVCLPQAIAAKLMLRRRGIAACLHFGVRRDGSGAFEAHAWVDAAGREVTGFPVAADFTKLAHFS